MTPVPVEGEQRIDYDKSTTGVEDDSKLPEAEESKSIGSDQIDEKEVSYNEVLKK